MKRESVLYIVEGETEKHFIDILKKVYIISGKVIVYDLAKKQLSLKNLFLKTISPNTTIVVVFDTDVSQAANIHRLSDNLSFLKTKIKHIKEIILIPQSHNLEEELIHSTSIRKIQDLIGSKSEKDFKRDFLKVREDYFLNRLKAVKFQIQMLWCRNPKNGYESFENQAYKVKVK